MAGEAQIDMRELHWLLDIVQCLDVGVLVMDRNFRVEVWNSFMENHSGLGADLCAIARGFGIADARCLDRLEDVDAVAASIRARAGTAFVQVRIEAEEPPRALPPRDGPFLKNRFRAALGLAPF